mmetsp:Transcript_26848/g.65247  ORF Transcript_26848/g.65247 Transcript_26848/m.65247 type:complete len:101 (-) Transcript_26848:286-588(-)
MMNSNKLLSLLVVFLVVTLAAASRRSSPTSDSRAFLGRRRGVSIPKLFDNRQVINMGASSSSNSKVVKLTAAEQEDYSNQYKKKSLHNEDELVYLSFHGF